MDLRYRPHGRTAAEAGGAAAVTLNVVIGWDTREVPAYEVCAFSMLRRSSEPLHIQPMSLSSVRYQKLYTRPMETRDGQLWDLISDAACSTQFAITRFLTPFLIGRDQHGKKGWALFCDCDMIWLTDIAELFALADDRYAVMCVQHNQDDATGEKMDGQPQQPYQRKNWSSMMLLNCDHPGIRDRLTIDMINTLPGRDLHRFCWLDDREIGALPPEWNWLEGYSDPSIDAKVVHLTRGGPWMAGWDQVAFAETWCKELRIARSQHHHAPRGQDPFVPHRNEMI